VSLSGTGTGFCISPPVAALTFTRTHQFTASSGGATSSADGVIGGSATFGTITAAGLSPQSPLHTSHNEGRVRSIITLRRKMFDLALSGNVTLLMFLHPQPSNEIGAHETQAIGAGFTWVAQQPETELFTTLVTEAEVFTVLSFFGRGKRRERLLATAEGMFSEDFAGRVFVFDSDAARVFAKIGAARRALGMPISHADAQIAALAQVRGSKLATRNVGDFEDCGIEVVDPWNG